MVDFGKVRVGDVGTRFQLQISDTDVNDVNALVDLTGATVLTMIFTNPDETEYTKTAIIANLPGTDGIIEFTNTDASFINLSGLWYHRARVTLASGENVGSNDAEFEVLGSKT